MLRFSLAALGLVVIVLVGLSFLPKRPRAIPESTIYLKGSRVTLFPQSDPAAVWHFTAPEVSYLPSRRETILHGIEDGERVVDGVTDFTLKADEVTIDARDNLRGQSMEVHLLEADWLLRMQGRKARPVVIDQERGKFVVPILDYTGEGLGAVNHAENVSMNFDLSDYEADCEGASCVNQFEDSGNQ